MSGAALAGKRLMVPVTARRQDLARRLADAGARVDNVEFIAIAPARDQDALAAATARWCAGGYDWLAVTSRNAVLAMAGVAAGAGTSLAAPQPAARVATVGEATLGVCVDLGLRVDLVPNAVQSARGIVAEFPQGPGTVLAPLGNLAAPTLERGLARKGWTVDAVEAYRTVDGPGPDDALVDALESGAVDAVLLTSGSVAERFAATCPAPTSATIVVAIGAHTAASARAAGLRVDAVSEQPSYDGIVAALHGAFAAESDVREEP